MYVSSAVEQDIPLLNGVGLSDFGYWSLKFLVDFMS
jgi:hypothetical protein